MLYAGGLLGLVLLLVWLFCIIDVIMTPGEDCQYLPKLLWLGIVVLLGDLGSALWLLVGRPWPGGSPLARLIGRGGPPRRGIGQRSAPAYPEYDHPDRFAASNPDDDDAFLAQVRARAEAQRRAETQRRREREQAEITAREQRARNRRDPRDAAAPDDEPDDPERGQPGSR